MEGAIYILTDEPGGPRMVGPPSAMILTAARFPFGHPGCLHAWSLSFDTFDVLCPWLRPCLLDTAPHAPCTCPYMGGGLATLASFRSYIFNLHHFGQCWRLLLVHTLCTPWFTLCAFGLFGMPYFRHVSMSASGAGAWE